LPAEQLARKLPELEQFELIGQGGMGAVYKARHRKLHRMVAVKVLDPNLSNDPSFAERFTREARTLAQLDHPNVVSICDFGRRDDVYYLIMELVDGVSLRQMIEAGGLKPQEALAMVPHICEALQYAHDQGVVHRDIKPENILVDQKGSIKIADFGLAKLVGQETQERLTQTRQVMGTPNYMAPEQIENPADVDHRADIFALGVIFYELLTGELPVGRFPAPSRRVQVDVRLDDVVLRTLEKEPHLRYQQASELQSDIVSISTGGYLMDNPADESSRRRHDERDYEYRSAKMMFGIPLIHIAFSRGPSSNGMRVANGIIALGDVAIGGVAVGGFSFGLITFGGINVGLVGFGGITLGLLFAMGGVGAGTFSLSAMAIGLVFAQGGLPISLVTLTDSAYSWAALSTWLLATVGFTAGAVAAVYAWITAIKARSRIRN